MEYKDRIPFYRLEEQIEAFFGAKTDCYAENNPWIIPYVGRRVLPEFYKLFQHEIGSGKYCLEFEWHGVEKYRELNYYDSETHEHYLEVVLFDRGVNQGLIKSIVSHHKYTWETTSNWQDHHESHSGEIGGPSDEDILKYCQILDKCTEDITDALVHNLILNMVTNDPTVGICKRSDREFVKLQDREGMICLDEICDVLRFGRSYFDIFMLPDYRIQRGVSTPDMEKRGIGYVLGCVALADVYGGGDELQRQVDRFLSLRMMRNVKRFENKAEEKLAWMAGEVMRVGRRVNRRRQFSVGYYPRYHYDLNFQFREGRTRYWPSSSAPTGTMCFFDRKNHCIGYVTTDKKIYNGEYKIIGMLDITGIVRKYEMNAFGWLFDESGKYVGCVGVLCDDVNVGKPEPFAQSKHVKLLRQDDSRLAAMNLFSFT